MQWRKAGRGSRAGHEGAEERVLSRDVYAVKSVLSKELVAKKQGFAVVSGSTFGKTI